MKPTKIEQIPTRQLTNWTDAKRAINARLKRGRKPVVNAIYDIPVKAVNIENNRTRYEYLITPERLTQIPNEINDIISQLLQVDGLKPQRWFFDQYINKAYQSGTATSAANISAQAVAVGSAAASQLDLENILFSEPYRRRIEIAGSRAFNNMKGFADGNATDLGRIMVEGIAMGESPRQISISMQKRWREMPRYRTDRIARTEVNKAFTDARIEQAVDANKRLGLDVRLMHVSALVPATRSTHAARHGKIYTMDEQERWWAEGSNRINCLCSTTEVLYIKGKPVNKSVIERQRERGKAYFDG